MAEKTISIAYIFFWISLAVFLMLILWKVFGNSPTFDMLSLGATAVGAAITWIALRQSSKTERILQQLYDINVDQMKVLKSIEKRKK